MPRRKQRPLQRRIQKLLDIGDFIGVRGYVFRTQTGEISVHARELTVLSKSLRPLPVVKVKDGVTYDAFDDPELRYRRRYVDLIVNDGVKEIFLKRTKVYNSMREYFNSAGYIEVETPILQSIPEEHRHVRSSPIIMHSTYLSICVLPTSFTWKRPDCRRLRRRLRILQELPATKAWTAPTTPEFTCMEIYVAYKDYNWMMAFPNVCSRKYVLT